MNPQKKNTNRREVSLTRRLASWLLGTPNADSAKQPDYFALYARQATIDALRALFSLDARTLARDTDAGRDIVDADDDGRMSSSIASSSSSSSSSSSLSIDSDDVIGATSRRRQRERALSDAACLPLRTLMHLLDTPDIGDSIIDDVLIDALLYLNRYKDGHTFSHDVMRSMNLMLEQLQPHMLWDFMCKLFSNNAVNRRVTVAESLLKALNNSSSTTTTTTTSSSSSSTSSNDDDNNNNNNNDMGSVAAAAGFFNLFVKKYNFK